MIAGPRETSVRRGRGLGWCVRALSWLHLLPVPAETLPRPPAVPGTRARPPVHVLHTTPVDRAPSARPQGSCPAHDMCHQSSWEHEACGQRWAARTGRAAQGDASADVAEPAALRDPAAAALSPTRKSRLSTAGPGLGPTTLTPREAPGRVGVLADRECRRAATPPSGLVTP